MTTDLSASSLTTTIEFRVAGFTPGENTRNVTTQLVRETMAGGAAAPAADERFLVTQKRAAELLSVNRVTIWRMTRDCLLHPVEILPGMWRYPLREIAQLAAAGSSRTTGIAEKIAV